MYIKKIINYENDDGETEIIVSDGEHEILCCAWEYKPENKDFELGAFLVKSVERIDKPLYSAQPNGYSYFTYDICGKLLDNGKVAVGSIIINIDTNDIPKDIKPNEYIKFFCTRIDLTQN